MKRKKPIASDSEAESDTEGQKGKWWGGLWGFGSFNSPLVCAIHQPQGWVELVAFAARCHGNNKTASLCGRHMLILSSQLCRVFSSANVLSRFFTGIRYWKKVHLIRAAQGTCTVCCDGLAGWGRGVYFLRCKTSKMCNNISLLLFSYLNKDYLTLFCCHFSTWFLYLLNLVLGLCVHIYVWF